ncbi:MAG: protease complex subunit PrcB family protein [Firmicutes bacterium]|nr:protease complex subunit PrcB family protein [Bacillota bacterium]
MKKLFKSLILFIICAFILFILSACNVGTVNTGDKSGDENKTGNKDAGNNHTEDTENNDTENDGNKEASYEKVEYETVEDIGTLPQDIQEKIEELKVKRGYTYFKIEDEYVILISMGEKNTGGYSISIVSVEDVEGTVKIIVEETSPKKDDIVIQVITYPYAVIKVKGIEEKFEVVNEKGEKFEFISLDEDLKEYTGTYVGQIDGNSIEIFVDKNMDIDEAGKPTAFRLEGEIKEYFDPESKNFKNFKTDEKVKFSFERNEHGQLILKMLERISGK